MGDYYEEDKYYLITVSYTHLINTELFEKYLERFREPARELPKHTWNKLKEMTNTPKTGENS